MCTDKIEEALDKYPVRAWIAIVIVCTFLLATILCAGVLLVWIAKVFWQLLTLIA